jgi:hypothetical protein
MPFTIRFPMRSRVMDKCAQALTADLVVFFKGVWSAQNFDRDIVASDGLVQQFADQSLDGEFVEFVKGVFEA